MKGLLIASLSTLVLAIATGASAQNMTAYNQNSHTNMEELTPFNLVYHGYQGYFSAQGIPSNGAFLVDVRNGEINAKDLVKSAIEVGRLAPDTINNESYLNYVQSQLDALNNN